MTASPLTALRNELQRQGLDGFIIPRADEHLGEYVPPSAERLAFLTGFTGSAGLAVVTMDKAAVFTDGRYVLQATRQTDPTLWERRHITEEPAADWLAANVVKGAKIGYDPLLISEDALARYTEAGLTMTPVTSNPVDRIWTDRPALPKAPARPHPLERAGRSSDDKRLDIATLLTQAGQDAAILTDPASICWLFNIRGGDVPFTPFALGFGIIHADTGAELFMDPDKLAPDTRAWLGNTVSVAARDALEPALRRLAGKKVRVDPAGSPVWFAQRLRDAGATVIAGPDPCLLPKACKNAVEQAGSREAHARDAVAMCRFLCWLARHAPHGAETEMSAAHSLLRFREQQSSFRGESFPAISGAGENGAIIHYRVTEDSNRVIRPGEVYLIDSGAQYDDGTTDITRTVWIGPGPAPAELRARVTRVLKGHIAIATLVFPQGIGGVHIDAFARRALWAAGLDYDHGTGHGVGSFLSVHEGPVSISRLARPVAIAPGMILSNEPGYYLPGEYGIRLENLLLVQAADIPATARPFLRFETLTWAPFDRALVDPALLTTEELAWLNAYHAQVLAKVGPRLGPDERTWLEVACRRIG
jgi:Xaa-Pro aminopeptidase